ncbi:hypothetical protein QBC37DRAFT_427149 [Rhypophila decipiens]|uniref:Uncharacterized protein n=1 Tax=Rhypophila decipiens TaxID=261697 RepID=A0AAN6Y8F4_9PEZI|nr:hypothetical protein QBC37DRAFT_427149 [Rhypophila decipiens]
MATPQLPEPHDGNRDPSRPSEHLSAVLHRRLSALPPELDGDTQLHLHDTSHGHDSFSPSHSPVPSAATTRVNSGLSEHDLSASIAENLKVDAEKNIATSASVEINDDAPASDDGPVNGQHDPLSRRMKAIRSLLILFSFKTIYTSLFTTFIVVVLINKVVETPGGVYWDASTTNYVVSVLSQVSVLLVTTSVHDLFSVLRPILAARQARGGRVGSSFASWVGLSPSAGWSTVFQVAAVGGFLNPWCNMRIVLPLLLLGFGSILKFQAEFEYYFIPGPVEASMPLYAGLNPPDVFLLSFINASDLSMYENAWAPSLLDVSLFATDFSLPDCPSETCRSVFLPGGVTNARLVRPHLNLTLYSVDNFRNSDVITIYNARGFVVKFETPAPDSLVFDRADDCVYGGQEIDNGVQICVKQDKESIIVGWSSCPIEIYDRKQCNEPNATWQSDPIKSGTRFSLLSQVASTSYDRKNQSIINMQAREVDTPQPVPLRAEDYKQIIAHAMQTTPKSSLMDVSNINSLDYSVSWMHRTFKKSFQTDNTSTVTFLHNFLATPVQFNFVAHIYANYTAVQRGFGESGLFRLPNDMIAFARGGRSASRLAILPWAGWVFIAVDLALHLGVFAGIVFVLFQSKAVGAGQIGVEDLDAVRVAQSTVAVLMAGNLKRSWFTKVRFPIPYKCRVKWANGMEEDRKKLFGEGAHREGVESLMEQGRQVLDIGLDPNLAGGMSAWRLARAASAGWMRMFQRTQ